MNAQTTDPTSVAPHGPKERRTYHAPRIEDYGAVNELTRSGPQAQFQDGQSGYTSFP